MFFEQGFVFETRITGNAQIVKKQLFQKHIAYIPSFSSRIFAIL